MFRRIRDDAGIDGTEAARRAGVSQATISRWESGLRIPTPQTAAEYTTALNSDPEIAHQLLQLITDLREQHRAGPRGAAFQNRVMRVEQAAATVGVFHPVLIPGALQTPAYARAIFRSGNLDDDEIEARTTARLQRGALLADPSRQYTFVLANGTLAWRSGDAETMARQLDHLIEVSHQRNVRLGVIPWGTAATVYPPSGFDLLDNRTAIVGLPSGAQFFTEPDDVKFYVAMLTKLVTMAVFDDAAREQLAEHARRYRSMTV